MIVGQAPGAKVHESGVPWADASGDHLIEWLDVERATFEDPNAFAIVPMGFCWPGRRSGGDLPPRPECAPTWHDRVIAELPRLDLTLLVGRYAQARYLGARAKPSLTETVQCHADYLADGMLPLPHPSWRSKLWMKKNPWFEREVLPLMRARVAALLAG
jgi:uracil-DNA glycosylase